jgi:hypothetical protein
MALLLEPSGIMGLALVLLDLEPLAQRRTLVLVIAQAIMIPARLVTLRVGVVTVIMP